MESEKGEMQMMMSPAVKKDADSSEKRKMATGVMGMVQSMSRRVQGVRLSKGLMS
jgi:hypothetical protein